MAVANDTLKREWQAFWLSLGFLTRIPMPVRIDYSQTLMNQSSLYFPVVGLLLGAIQTLLFLVLATVFSTTVSVLLVLCWHLWITGAFHEDGLADSADGLGGGYTVAKRLSIMKDSRIGTYGTASLVLALALKAALLVEMTPIWPALLLGPMVARLAPLLLMGSLKYVSASALSKSKPVANGFSQQRLMIAGLFTAVVVALFSIGMPWLVAIALIAVVGVAGLWGLVLNRQLGGYTGDTLGACVVLAELVFLLLLSIVTG